MDDADHARHAAHFFNPMLSAEYDVSAHLDLNQSVLQNFLWSEVTGTDFGVMFGNTYHAFRVLTAFGHQSTPLSLLPLTTLTDVNLRITVNLMPISVQEEIAREEREFARIQSQHRSEGRPSLVSVLEKKQRKLQGLMQRHLRPFRVEVIIENWATSLEELRSGTSAVQQCILSMNGAQSFAPTHAISSCKVLLQTFPGFPWGPYSRSLVYAESTWLPDYFPLEASFTGRLGSQPDALYMSPQGSVVGVSFFSAGQPSHFAIISSSGGGKSMLIGDMLSQTPLDFLGVIDYGQSHETLLRARCPEYRPIVIEANSDVTFNYLDPQHTVITPDFLAMVGAIGLITIGERGDERFAYRVRGVVTRAVQQLFEWKLRELERDNFSQAIEIARLGVALQKACEKNRDLSVPELFADFRQLENDDPERASRFAQDVSEADALQFLKSSQTRLSAAFLAAAWLSPEQCPQPVDQSASLGANVTFNTRAKGTAPMSFQWRFELSDKASATNSILTLTNLQIASAGAYTLVVSDSTGATTSRVAILDVDPSFTKISAATPGAERTVVADADEFFNVSWADFRNKGYPDVFCGSPSGKTNYLYQNNGDGTFSRVAQTNIPPSMNREHGAAWGDYDNDGYVDLFVTGGQNDPGAFASFRNVLYRNNGNGSFTAITNGLFATESGQFHFCSWVDYDRDGFIDLFVTHHGASGGGPPAKNRLYHNEGDGTFRKITEGAIVNDLGDWLGRAWADYDNDGWPDLFVPNFSGGSQLYHNDGDGHFSTVKNSVVTADTIPTQHAAWADYDNDGYPDLFVARFDTSKTRIQNTLYHNEANGQFSKVTQGSIVTDFPPPQSPGGILGAGFPTCAWADYDNDGFVDLIVQAWVGDNQGVSYLYHNNGDGTFTRQTRGSIVNDKAYYQTYAWGDLNRDGFLDLYVAQGAAWGFVYGGRPGAGNVLYRNNGNSNSWIDVKLVGTVSNRSAIGAKVRAKAFYRGQERWQLRELLNGDGIGNEMHAHFGFGDATVIESLRIEWPSGLVQEFSNVPVKEFLTITEPPRLLTTNSSNAVQFALKGGRGLQYTVESSTDLKDWRATETVTITNLSGINIIGNQNGSADRARFYRATGTSDAP